MSTNFDFGAAFTSGRASNPTTPVTGLARTQDASGTASPFTNVQPRRGDTESPDTNTEGFMGMDGQLGSMEWDDDSTAVFTNDYEYYTPSHQQQHTQALQTTVDGSPQSLLPSDSPLSGDDEDTLMLQPLADYLAWED